LETENAGGKKRWAEDSEGRGSGKGKKGDGKSKQGGKGSGKNTGKDGKKKQGNSSDTSKYKTLRNNKDKLGLEFQTKDGTFRCHRFGSGGDCPSDCRFSHTCAKCGESHPTVRCPQLRGAY